jgi:hypothetical protein
MAGSRALLELRTAGVLDFIGKSQRDGLTVNHLAGEPSPGG